jgi:hypothetical protein
VSLRATVPDAPASASPRSPGREELVELRARLNALDEQLFALEMREAVDAFVRSRVAKLSQPRRQGV